MSRVALLAAVASAATAAVTAAGVVAAESPVAEVRGRPAAPVLRTELASLEGSPEASAVQAPAGPRPVELLRAWDARRAAAWAAGDAERLAALYTRGSVAGRRDVAMLRAWTARGLVVRGLTTQLIAVRPLGSTATSWTLEVTDRLARGFAVGAGTRQRLPTDRATTRVVVIRRAGGRWRVASVLSPHAWTSGGAGHIPQIDLDRPRRGP